MSTHARTSPGPMMALNARTAGELMTPIPLSIRQSATVAETAAFLSGKGISAAPVIDEAGRPVGVVSRTDLLNHRAHRSLRLLDSPNEGPPVAFAGDGTPATPGHEMVSDVMTPAVFCVRLGTPAGKVVEKLLALRVRRLFVVDGDGVLVGVISAFDVLENLRPEVVAGDPA